MQNEGKRRKRDRRGKGSLARHAARRHIRFGPGPTMDVLYGGLTAPDLWRTWHSNVALSREVGAAAGPMSMLGLAVIPSDEPAHGWAQLREDLGTVVALREVPPGHVRGLDMVERFVLFLGLGKLKAGSSFHRPSVTMTGQGYDFSRVPTTPFSAPAYDENGKRSRVWAYVPHGDRLDACEHATVFAAANTAMRDMIMTAAGGLGLDDRPLNRGWHGAGRRINAPRVRAVAPEFPLPWLVFQASDVRQDVDGETDDGGIVCLSSPLLDAILGEHDDHPHYPGDIRDVFLNDVHCGLQLRALTDIANPSLEHAGQQVHVYDGETYLYTLPNPGWAELLSTKPVKAGEPFVRLLSAPREDIQWNDIASLVPENLIRLVFENWWLHNMCAPFGAGRIAVPTWAIKNYLAKSGMPSAVGLAWSFVHLEYNARGYYPLPAVALRAWNRLVVEIDGVTIDARISDPRFSEHQLPPPTPQASARKAPAPIRSVLPPLPLETPKALQAAEARERLHKAQEEQPFADALLGYPVVVPPLPVEAADASVPVETVPLSEPVE